MMTIDLVVNFVKLIFFLLASYCTRYLTLDSLNFSNFQREWLEFVYSFLCVQVGFQGEYLGIK